MPAAVLGLALAAATVTAPAQLAPSVVLERYADALASIAQPKAVIFNYTIAQVGQAPLYQTHRIYRSGTLTRDETVEIDGHPLSVPAVHIVAGHEPHYRIAQLAPSPADYSFTFVKAVLTVHHWSYVFKTAPNAPRPFTVTSVTIDGARFLPSRIDFTSTEGTVLARGTFTFAPVDKYWLIQEADVEAPITGERSAERIVWRNYSFPQSLPPETLRGKTRLSGVTAPVSLDLRGARRDVR